MTTQRPWFWTGAGVATAAAALALGVPLVSVLIVASAYPNPGGHSVLTAGLSFFQPWSG